ncbi:MAG: O-antigen ligase family protein [Chloroflexota bacterium]
MVIEILTWTRLSILVGIIYCLAVLLSIQPPPTPKATIHHAEKEHPFLGVTVQLEYSEPTDYEARLHHLHQHGIGWVRQRFDWGLLEPNQGQFDWTQSDVMLNAIVASGLTPVVVLDGSPAWAREAKDRIPNDNPFAPPADLTTFANFAAAFAQRYQHQVYYYQLWDEPNIAPHWGNRHIEPVAYAQLLKAASQAIRAVDADAVIIAASLAPTRDQGHTAIDEVTFLNRLYAAGAAPYFDVLAVQPFGFNYTATDDRQQRSTLNFQRIAWVRRAMVAAGDGETPVWAMRYGWHVPQDMQDTAQWGAVSEQGQVAFTREAIDMAHTEWPWLTAMGWVIDIPHDESMRGFALFDEQGNPMPVLKEMSRNMVILPTSVSLADGQDDRVTWLYWIGLFLALWRGYYLARSLPWQRYILRYQLLPILLQVTIWIIVLNLYELATSPILIVFCLGFMMFLIAARPIHGLIFAVLFIPFFFQHKEIHWFTSIVKVPSTHALALCLSPILVVTVLKRWASIRLNRADTLALGLLALSLFSSTSAWHWTGYQQGMIDFVLVPLVLYVAVRLFVRTRAQYQWVVWVLFASGLWVAFIGLQTWVQGGGTVADNVLRLVGPHYSPNHTALYLLRTVFIGVGLLFCNIPRPPYKDGLRLSRTPYLFWLGGMGLLLMMIIIALMLTVSRGALFLGIPAGGLVMLWSLRHYVKIVYERRNVAWIMGALGMIAIACFAVITVFYWDRVSNSATLIRRFAIWQTTLQLVWAYPLGVGPGGFFWHYPAYLPIPTELSNSMDPNLRHPHNVWLEFAANWGWLGILWLGMWIVVCVRSIRQRDAVYWIRVGIVAAFVASFAHGQMDAFVALEDLAAWHWVAFGLLVQPIRER